MNQLLSHLVTVLTKKIIDFYVKIVIKNLVSILMRFHDSLSEAKVLRRPSTNMQLQAN